MEKSAHPAAIATRLNNLEQKFDEANELDMNELLAIIAQLYKLTLSGSEKNTGEGLSDDWYKNPNLFDDFSFAMAVFGSGLENFQIYDAQKTLNFYNRVFGSAINFENVGGVLPLSHALFMNVGKSFTYEWNNKSLTETIFGSDDNISYLHEEGSLFDKIFGDGANYLQNEASLFDKIFGNISSIDANLDEISGDENSTSFLNAVQRFRRNFDYFELMVETYQENIEQRLVSLSQRVSALEARI